MPGTQAIQQPAPLRTNPRALREAAREQSLAPLLKVTEATGVVLAFAYVAAYAEMEGQTHYWKFVSPLGAIGLSEVVRGGMFAAFASVFFVFFAAVAASGVILVSAGLDWVAKKLPLSAQPANQPRLPQNLVSGLTTAAFGVAFAMCAAALFWWRSHDVIDHVAAQSSYLVTNADGVEYVVVYSQGELSWGYRYDRGVRRLCSQMRSFDRKSMQGVIENLGKLQPPTPKQATTDSCGGPLPMPTPSR